MAKKQGLLYRNSINDAYNSLPATVGKILDPTGISSYGDVAKAWGDKKFTASDILEPLGALPIVGKLGKAGKILYKAGKFGKTLSDISNAKKVIAATKYSNKIQAGGRTLKKSFATTNSYGNVAVRDANKLLKTNKNITRTQIGLRTGADIPNIVTGINQAKSSTIVDKIGGFNSKRNPIELPNVEVSPKSKDMAKAVQKLKCGGKSKSKGKGKFANGTIDTSRIKIPKLAPDIDKSTLAKSTLTGNSTNVNVNPYGEAAGFVADTIGGALDTAKETSIDSRVNPDSAMAKNSGIDTGKSILSGAAKGFGVAGPWGALAGAAVAGLGRMFGAAKRDAQREEATRDWSNAWSKSTAEGLRSTGYKKGGKITGKGSAKSDSIPMKAKEGSFIVPAENSSVAEELGRSYLGWDKKEKAAKNNGGTDIKVSDGEVMFSPEEVQVLKYHGVNLDELAPKAEEKIGMKKGGGVKKFADGTSYGGRSGNQVFRMPIGRGGVRILPTEEELLTWAQQNPNESRTGDRGIWKPALSTGRGGIPVARMKKEDKPNYGGRGGSNGNPTHSGGRFGINPISLESLVDPLTPEEQKVAEAISKPSVKKKLEANLSGLEYKAPSGGDLNIPFTAGSLNVPKEYNIKFSNPADQPVSNPKPGTVTPPPVDEDTPTWLKNVPELAGALQAAGGAFGLIQAGKQPDLTVSRTLTKLSGEVRRLAQYGYEPRVLNALNTEIENTRRNLSTVINNQGSNSGIEQMAKLNSLLTTTIDKKAGLAFADAAEKSRKWSDVLKVDAMKAGQEFDINKIKVEDWYRNQEVFASLVSAGISNIIGARQLKSEQENLRKIGNTSVNFKS